jgi:hypothetical protein
VTELNGNDRAMLIRIDENVKMIREKHEVLHTEVRNGFAASDETHRTLWCAISKLRVRDAYVAGVFVVAMAVFGALLAWALK